MFSPKTIFLLQQTTENIYHKNKPFSWISFFFQKIKARLYLLKYFQDIIPSL